MVDVAPSGMDPLGRRERRRTHFRLGAGSKAPSAGTVQPSFGGASSERRSCKSDSAWRASSTTRWSRLSPACRSRWKRRASTSATSPKTAQLLLGRAIGRVATSIDEVRRVVWALRDESLDMRGLATSLREIGRQLASCHADSIEVEVEVEGNPHPFVVPVENNLLRIGQEALTNAVKHGKPSRIDVRLRYDHATFSMRVSDDGLGFDTACPPPPGHFGLAGMRERAAEIGARLELSSRVNGGTEVQVTVDLGDQP